MPCYRPIRAYVSMHKTAKGKKEILFKKPNKYREEIDINCGQCIGCRLKKAQTWAVRCVNELQLYDSNCFITLTYDDEFLPEDHSLNPKHFTDFLKRLRDRIKPRKIRYFMCGEYGDLNWRPHYHAIIFNYDFPDKIRVQSRDVNNPYYISTELSLLWKFGNHIIADANYDTCAYVARYLLKKVNGEKSEAHYNRDVIDWNEYTGEIYSYKNVDLIKEYARMSLKPGIGKEWYEKYKKDCFPSDYLIVNGYKVKVPDYYLKMFENYDEYQARMQKNARRINAIMRDDKPTIKRLTEIEEVKKKQMKSLQRGL